MKPFKTRKNALLADDGVFNWLGKVAKILHCGYLGILPMRAIAR